MIITYNFFYSTSYFFIFLVSSIIISHVLNTLIKYTTHGVFIYMNKKIISSLLVLCIFIFPLSKMTVHADDSMRRHATDIPGNEDKHSTTNYVPSDAPNVSCSSGIIMDIDTGNILYEKNSEKKSYPASTTKLMTALLCLEDKSIYDTVKVSSSALKDIPENATTMNLIAGETISYEELLYGLLLVSANEAANVIAENVSGDISSFTDKMNTKAKELGCTDTHFSNANGLHNNDHYTTAYDMALIAANVYQNSDFRNIIKTTYHVVPKTDLSSERDLWTSNQSLYDSNDIYYKYCTGGKTGYTEEAGECLVSFAERNGIRLVAVLYNCDEDKRFKESKELFEFAFNNYTYIKPLENFDMSTAFTSENDTYLMTNYNNMLIHEMPDYSFNHTLGLTVRTDITVDKFTVTPVINQNINSSVAGYISVMYNNKELLRTDFIRKCDLRKYIDKNASKESQTVKMKKHFKALFDENGLIIILSLVLVVLLIVLLILYKTLRKIKRPNVHHYSGRNYKKDKEKNLRKETSERKVEGKEINDGTK